MLIWYLKGLKSPLQPGVISFARKKEDLAFHIALAGPSIEILIWNGAQIIGFLCTSCPCQPLSLGPKETRIEVPHCVATIARINRLRRKITNPRGNRSINRLIP